MRLTSCSFVLLLLLQACATESNSVQDTKADGAAMKVAAAKDCNDDGFCTREYLPTSCQFSGQSFDGSNPCEAKKLARRYACEKGLSFADADVACKSKEEGAVETKPAAAPQKKGKGK